MSQTLFPVQVQKWAPVSLDNGWIVTETLAD